MKKEITISLKPTRDTEVPTPNVASSSGLHDETLALEKEGPSVERQEAIPFLLVGTTVNGRYRVEQMLGKGSMGVVYKVVDDLHPDRQIALKTIYGRAISENRLGRFKAEFATMAEFRHPNVASVYDFEAMQGTDDYFFTMDFVAGDNLYEATEGKNWQEILGFVVQVCRALAYVHSRRLIHFDLKPANVLVGQDNRVKVLDFGLAGTQIAAGSGRVKGTLAYMAPELVDVGSADYRVDLYSLGIVIYELLCRKLPFSAASPQELLYKHASEPIVFDDEIKARVPGWLLEIVKRLCAKQPTDRFRTANAVIDAINKQGGISYEIETEETKQSYILSSRFVGRDREFARFKELIAERTKPTLGAAEDLNEFPPAFWVIGQSGVGKSRLMREVRYHVQLSRLTFLEGNCYEGAFSEFGPIIEVARMTVRLAQALGQTDLLDRFGPELTKLEPQLTSEIDVQPSPSLVNAEAERLHLLEGVSDFFIQLSERVPYILHLNDLQWARPGTTDLLFYLVRRIAQKEAAGRRTRLAVLGSFRDDEIEGRPIKGMIEALKAGEEYLEQKLEPLGYEHVDALLESMLGVDKLPEAFVQRVMEETAGNPFFVEEVMRTLVENGSVYLEDGQWAAAKEVGELEIPANMASVFLRRASLLSVRQRHLLDVMAVYGKPMAVSILQAVTGIDHSLIHPDLVVLHQRGMVVNAPGEELLHRISHDRMRHTLYCEVSEEQRRALHEKIGETIEALYAANLRPHLYDLAHHYWLSGNKDKAFIYNLEAGNLAKDNYANDLGIECYQHVLELLESQPARANLRAAVVESLGDLCLLEGRYDEALRSYAQAESGIRDNVDRARLTRKLGDVYQKQGELRKAADQCWRAISLLGDYRPRTGLGIFLMILRSLVVHGLHRFVPFRAHIQHAPAKRARMAELCATYCRLSYITVYLEAKYLALTELRAGNIADSLGDSREAAHAYGSLCFFFGNLRLLRSAMLFGRKCVEMAKRIGSAWNEGVGILRQSMALFYANRWKEALELSVKAKDMLLKYGDMYEISLAYMQSYYSAYYMGNLKSALQYAEEGFGFAERTGSWQMGKGLLGCRGVAAGRMGKYQLGKDLLAQAMVMCEQAGDVFMLSICGLMQGDLLLEGGEIEKAISSFEIGLKARDAMGTLTDYNSSLYALFARALIVQQGTNAAGWQTPQGFALRQRIARLLRKGRFLALLFGSSRSPLLLTRGLFEWRLGHRSRAKKLFTKSIAAAERLGAQLQLAIAYDESGRSLLEAEGADVEIGRSYLEKALALYQECDAGLYIPRIRALLGH